MLHARQIDLARIEPVEARVAQVGAAQIEPARLDVVEVAT